MISRVPRVALFCALAALSACHKSGGSRAPRQLAPVIPPPVDRGSPAGDPARPEAQPLGPKGGSGRVTVPTQELVLAKPDAGRIELGNGAYVPVQHVAGEPHVGVIAIVENASFARFAAFDGQASQGAGAAAEREYQLRLDARLRATAQALQEELGPVRELRFAPRFGYFSMRMKLAAYQRLSEVKGLPADLLVNPVVVTPDQDKSLRKMDRKLAEEVISGRLSNDGYSGLARMGVPEFLEAVSAELGETPTGSRVRVGVTDTGVTYAHPSFTDEDGESRIVYMRDFTGEGRLYFNPAARFAIAEATAEEVPEGIDPAAVLLIDAQAVRPVAGAISQPVADDFFEVKTRILVSPELKAALLAPGAAARLGVTTEVAFKLEQERVDLNRNGKDDDAVFGIVVQQGDEIAVYATVLDGARIPDFRLSPRLSSFNASKDLMSLGSERFGFDVDSYELANADGSPATVLGASLVGFDPGNHGSHVSGIIAGRKTIANDVKATLARGAAPGAPLMVNRVCANNGGCNGSDALVDLAMSGAEVINMSLGGLSPFNDGYSVQDVLIDRVTQVLGTLFVISAGNSGPGFNTVGSPSVSREALSVGAAASRSLLERQYQWPGTGKPGPLPAPAVEEDFMLFFSSRGPTAAGGFKPEIAAPGTELSAIQLNSALGLNAGLDVYWGTSMAAPSAAGAIALLLDAAKAYNAKHPDAALPLDARTIKRVLLESARPFDVFRFDPATGELTRGQYTWIDQGLGMINLPRAWAALKQEAEKRLPSALKQANPDVAPDVALDYQVRVLRTGPSGIPYDGELPLPPEMMAMTGPRFGRGIWLDPDAQDSLIQVQVARRLPQGLERRPDFNELQTLLATTQDRFVLRTVIYGSTASWVKAGTLAQLDCAAAPTAELNLVGLGAVDNFSAPPGEPKSVALRDSLLNVCVDRAMLGTLPAGDHGAVILAYRTDGSRTEATPSFVVPVYVSIPQKTLAGGAGYDVEGVTQAFGVARHYVKVPEGTSVVTVKLEVPEASQSGSVVRGCASARLYAYEGGPTSTPAEIAGNVSIAANCDANGRPTEGKRIVSYSRPNPTPGIWNLHVFGRYEFPSSPYRLSVSFAKVQASLTEIKGTPAALDGSLDFSVVDASFAAEPSAERSTFALSGFQQTVRASVATDQQLDVPDADGQVLRAYDSGVTSVKITTGGSPGNDIDLYVHECNEAGEACQAIGQSGGATDVEAVTFTPAAGKRYRAQVIGYKIEQGGGAFELGETRMLVSSEAGTLSVEAVGERSWTIRYLFDETTSALLSSPLFTSGKFQVVGDITLRTAAGSTMTRLPVEVRSIE